MRDMILILGAETPSGRAVARKLRAEHYYCRLLPSGAGARDAAAESPAGVILAGEADEGAFAPDADIFSLGLPVLALGSSARAACAALGEREAGEPIRDAVVSLVYGSSALFEGVDAGERWIARADSYALPERFRIVAQGDGVGVGYADEQARQYLLQLQIERNDPDGMAILLNFARSVCGCTPWWTTESFIASAETGLRAALGDGRALCAMSGGLDSTVAAMLARRAAGERARCLFVDTGRGGRGEPEEAERYFRDELMLDFHRVDASARVLRALSGLKGMDEKWRVIIREIRRVLAEEAESMGGPVLLVKGTTYADILQRQGEAATPSQFDAVAEPLRELFKDEIRAVGRALGLSDAMITRQPFPGMGLAARIYGEVTAKRLETLRTADAIFAEELGESGLARRVPRFFAVLGEIEGREAIVLRATQENDVVRSPARLPYDLLERTVEHIRKALPDVSRVFYDMTTTRVDHG